MEQELPNDRILFKATAAERYIDFQLISRARRDYRHVYVPRTYIAQTRRDDLVIVDMIDTLVILINSKNIHALNIAIYWPDKDGRPMSDTGESVYVPYDAFMDFYWESRQPCGPAVWRSLDMDYFMQPKFVFEDKGKLHQCLVNEIVRKKLIRYLRDNFYGGVGDSNREIHFCAHPKPYSFTIKKVSSFSTHVQEMVLRGQNDLSTARYWVTQVDPEIWIPGTDGKRLLSIRNDRSIKSWEM